MRQRSHSLRRVIGGITVLVLAIALGTLGYVLLTGRSFLDALFMVIITIFSVGYEETIEVDHSPILQWYTIGFIVIGCGSMLYVVGGLIQMGTEGEINRALGAHRMSREISSLKRHTIICGFGRMGQVLADQLRLSNSPFVIIEKNEERALLAEELGYLVMRSNATEDSTLVDAGIEQAVTLATVLPVDADNLFITLSARSLNKDLQIFARGEMPTTEAKLHQAGADHVVLPATIGGVRMAHMIVRPSAEHFLSSAENAETLNSDLEELGVHLNELQVRNDPSIAGRTVADIEIEGPGAYLIVAIRHADGTVVTAPNGKTKVRDDDTIIVIGHGNVSPVLTTEPTPAREIVADS